MRQFLEIKSRYPDAILMFRMGDFYEMFFEDAVIVAPILDIALTSRDKGVENAVPMAGVPYHAISGYLRTLVERGMKVAICEQMETPEEAKRRKGPNIVNREVVRVVTPGARVDEDHLPLGEPNYLAALVVAEDKPVGKASAAIALLDISAGDFIVITATDEDTVRAELARFSPQEILAQPRHHAWIKTALGASTPRLEGLPEALPKAPARRVDVLAEQSRVELPAQTRRAAAHVLAYAEATQPGQTLLIARIRKHETAAHLVVDETTIRNLELFSTLRDGRRKGTLLWAVDATRTAMGARMLRAWIAAPTRNLDTIRARADGVEALVGEATLRAELQSHLKDVRDVVRLAARARLGTITPRQLGALRASLHALPGLAARVGELAERRIDRVVPPVLELGDDLLPELLEDLDRTLVEDPPTISREGGMIASGCDAALDEQRALRDGGRDALAAIETRERERTQIPNLKIQHNRVFGYYLEVSRSHLSKVPSDYVRKQTMVNAERYVTEELAGYEAKVLGAEALALARELVLFGELRARVSEAGERLCGVSERLAQLDAIAGLAEIAARHDFVRPEMVETPVLDVELGRHPVVERMLDAGTFVPNDVALKAQGGASDEKDARLWLITGPNMGGKSTVMRQIGLIAILAHAGSFVPAKRAKIGIVDRVFTRVGAADDLGRGDSTFMVEMRETAQILNQASARSLVLLDEIGRGTATFDGLSLAWAIVEHLHDQVGCRTMFATHYHELCGLEGVLAGVRNVHLTVHEHRGRIIFLHQLAAGPAGRSYGIAVGRLAGLPSAVLRRAGRILERLEADPHGAGRPQLDLFSPSATAVAAAPSVDSGHSHDVLDRLEDTDPDDLSPRQAHDLLRDLVARLQGA